MKFKESLQWLKNLFLDYKKPMNRKEILNVFGILWFINLASCTYYISNSLSTMMINTKGISWLAAYNIFSRFSSLEFAFCIPWTTLLLLGCILYVFRLYAQKNWHYLLKISLGIAVFYLFRFFLLFILLIPDSEGFFTTDPTLLSLLTPSLHLQVYILGWIKFIGFTAIIFPYIYRREKSKSYDSRELFLQRTFLVSFISYLLIIVFIAINKNDLFDNNPMNKLKMWLPIFILLGLIQIFLCLQRLYNSNISFWHLFLILVPIILAGCACYLLLQSKQLIFANYGQYLYQLAFGLSNIFFFILVLAKPKQKEYN